MEGEGLFLDIKYNKDAEIIVDPQSKKILSIVLALALVFTMLPGFALTVFAAEGENPFGGDGLSGSPYEISTAEQLARLAE